MYCAFANQESTRKAVVRGKVENMVKSYGATEEPRGVLMLVHSLEGIAVSN
jgi:hypothetical protein